MDTPRNDGGARALSRLLSQFQGKPRTEGITVALALEAHDADAGLYTLWSGRQLATAAGASLDVYGQLVGEQRLGREDDVYRIAILARRAINRSSGTHPELLRLLRLLAPLPLHLSLVRRRPAALVAYVRNGPLLQPEAVFAALSAAKLGGVNLRMRYQDVPDAQRFTTAGGIGLGFAGMPTDYVSAREDVRPIVNLPGTVTLGSVSMITNNGGGMEPVVSLTGGTVPEYMAGSIALEVVDPSPDYTFQWFKSDGSATWTGGSDQMFPGGEEVPVELRDQHPNDQPAVQFPGVPTGIAVKWQEGDPYASGDTAEFQVTIVPGAPVASTPPTLDQVAPLTVTGRVVVDVLDGFRFRYTVGSAAAREVDMARGTAVPLLRGDGTPTGVAITWPNVTTHYTGASWAWQLVKANPVVGGRFIRVLW